MAYLGLHCPSGSSIEIKSKSVSQWTEALVDSPDKSKRVSLQMYFSKSAVLEIERGASSAKCVLDESLTVLRPIQGIITINI